MAALALITWEVAAQFCLMLITFKSWLCDQTIFSAKWHSQARVS